MMGFNNAYDRNNAVKYALTYALRPNPKYKYFPLINDKSGDCANFVSQCLLAGNSKMNFDHNNQWWYRFSSASNTNTDTWSVSWAVAHSLYYYLRNNENSKSQFTKGLEVSNPSELEIGDLIFFQDNKGTIFHSSIVTSIYYGKPFISQHSFQARNIYYMNSYKASKYHYLKIII